MNTPCRPQSKLRVAVVLAGLSLLAGCGLPRPTTVPLRTLSDNAPCASRPDTLLVLLPGASSRPEEFLREGFVRALRQRRLALDVVLVDAHLGYYKDRIILERLQADVIDPARAKGYRNIWLVGVSLGGFGAVIQALARPADTSGLILLAPYLGERRVSDAVELAGGLRAWRAPAASEGEADDMDLRVWRWLQGYATDPATRPPLYLGFALDDRLAPSNRLLAAALPADRVFTTPGGHDWPEWSALWDRMLDRAAFPVDASCALPAARRG